MTVMTGSATDRAAELVIIEISAMLGRRRMNQAAMARALGKTPMWVSDRMTGRVRLAYEDIVLIARALGVNVVDLLPRSERVETLRYPQWVDFEIQQEQPVTPVSDYRASPFAGRFVSPLPPGTLPAQPPPGRNRTSPTANVP